MLFIIIVLNCVFGYQCISRDNLDATIDTCKSIIPYSPLAKLDNLEMSGVSITISNMQNEPIWRNFYIGTQNALRCMSSHPACDVSMNRTIPICVNSCVKFADAINTFESGVKAFCIKYFNPTQSLDCAMLGQASVVTISMTLLLFMIIITFL